MGATTLGDLGPFFVVETSVADPALRPLADLLEGDGLAERVAWTGEALSSRAGVVRRSEPGTPARVEVEERVAASTASLGVFARLLSPVIGAALLGVDAPGVDGLHWQPVDGGPLRLAADAWVRPDVGAVLGQAVAPLVRRLDDEHGVSTKIGWGNAVSAVHGAARMAAQADPDLSREAGRLLRELLEHPLLTGTADVGPPFVRRSCCLYYRIPGGGYCGDCVLAHSG
ncbi:(2Fe-2S)-binding protein [Aeromicrobium sp. Leaf350]|uniref:(2Fe-2S)-binding protein n=1 Tax=Aeromicrobium sp. Leaf350 TaxID=2876565 RepID=UPI001E3D99F1|nr:(2Fe-2S)-binding protein [Aeromicrobium sp. Leaf350]